MIIKLKDLIPGEFKVYKTTDGDLVSVAARETDDGTTVSVFVNTISTEQTATLVDSFPCDSHCDFNWGMVKAALAHGNRWSRLYRKAMRISWWGL